MELEISNRKIIEYQQQAERNRLVKEFKATKPRKEPSGMSRILPTLYGVIAYLTFLGAFLYAIGFVGNYLVPKSIDSGTEGDPGLSILINLGTLGLFAFQHSLMARPFFKKWWKRFVPEVIERSTYVLFASFLLILILWQWQPLKGVIWQVDLSAGRVALQALSLLGWFIVLASTFMINHFELVGLRQVYLNLKGQPYRPLPFTTRFLYHFIRHPLMLGFLIAFWATPDMTVGHLIFAAATTGYILVGIQLEERDLMVTHREEYSHYRRTTSMLVPLPGKSQPKPAVRQETIQETVQR